LNKKNNFFIPGFKRRKLSSNRARKIKVFGKRGLFPRKKKICSKKNRLAFNNLEKEKEKGPQKRQLHSFLEKKKPGKLREGNFDKKRNQEGRQSWGEGSLKRKKFSKKTRLSKRDLRSSRGRSP